MLRYLHGDALSVSFEARVEGKVRLPHLAAGEVAGVKVQTGLQVVRPSVQLGLV